MSKHANRQVVITGVGGQGILFITRLLAEAAINNKLPVFTSETHGMAQRGGTVLSHLKVGNFSSPLIRPNQADVLLALKTENLPQHGYYLKSDGWAVVNSSTQVVSEADWSAYTVDANKLALNLQNPKSVNLVLLGFALAVSSTLSENTFFCSLEDIKSVLKNRLAGNQKMLDASIVAIEAGFASCKI